MKNYHNLFAILLSMSSITQFAVNTPLFAQQSFIEIKNNEFIAEGKPFRFIGANAVNFIFYDDFKLNVERAIDNAKNNNINVLRIYLDWGWCDYGDWNPEEWDYFLDIAARKKIYLLLTFTLYFNGSLYMDLASETCIKAFKDRIQQIIRRRNTINGKRYSDDTAIFGWDIANEPELWNYSNAEIMHWISETATHIKRLDPNHLVTIGLNYYPYEALNIPELDFFSFHFYAVERNGKNEFYLLNDYPAQISFITSKFLSMGKPVVMEEFGYSTSGELNFMTRKNIDSVASYCNVFKNSMDAAFSSGASGAMFWAWGVPEDKKIPLWWSKEDHDTTDSDFCSLMRNYIFPGIKTDVYDNSIELSTNESYELKQNYPNPFNPTTKIQFGLPEKALTKLTIYDVLGRQIEILLEDELNAGYHEVEFHAKNLPSGIYFYKIQANAFIQTRKLILIK